MHQRLKQTSLKRGPEKTTKSKFSQVRPTKYRTIQMIDHGTDQYETDAPSQHLNPRRCSSIVRNPAQKCHAVREPNREKELRHDCVGIAAVCVVMLQDR